ncbi:MAG: hypothetical protein JNL40_02110 [Cyclobacteriaceae bacterium]|nr:hypothetical protein [Cyclobacteriaceae bacterium]
MEKDISLGGKRINSQRLLEKLKIRIDKILHLKKKNPTLFAEKSFKQQKQIISVTRLVRNENPASVFQAFQVRISKLSDYLQNGKQEKQSPQTPTAIQPTSSKDTPTIGKTLTLECDWNCVIFQDGFIQVYVRPFKRWEKKIQESRRSFELIKPAFQRFNTEHLRLRVENNEIKDIENIDDFKKTLLFLSIQNDVNQFFQLPDSRLIASIGGSLRRVTNKQIIDFYNLHNRGFYMDYLCKKHDEYFKIVPVVETHSDHRSGILAEDGFIFTRRKGSSLFFVWESTLQNRATFIFRTTPTHHQVDLQRVFDFISSNRERKRSIIREASYKPNPLGAIGRVIHSNHPSWQVSMSKIMKE